MKLNLTHNQFMKVLIACGLTLEQLRDFEWFITNDGPGSYHCIGYHSVLPRIDIIKHDIIIF